MKVSNVAAAAIALQTVWNRHDMTAKTTAFALEVAAELGEFSFDVARFAIAAALFTYWFLNKSTWSKDTMPRLQPAFTEQPGGLLPDPTPTIEAKPSPVPIKHAPSMAWTKPDLVSTCRCYGLSLKGNKTDLLARIEQRLGYSA